MLTVLRCADGLHSLHVLCEQHTRAHVEPCTREPGTIAREHAAQPHHYGDKVKTFRYACSVCVCGVFFSQHQSKHRVVNSMVSLAECVRAVQF